MRVLFPIFCSIELKEAEMAHRDAVAELEKMRDAMVKMEQERLEMVAEVEAQIERALASMQVEVLSDVSEYSDRSRPNSRMSDIPTISRRPMTPDTPTSRSRRGSVTEKRLRSYGTESTLVDYDDDARYNAADRSTTVIEETEEEAENGERRKRSSIDDAQEIPDEDVTIVKKRFSAEGKDIDKNHQDAMGAVDMGISEKSDKIAQKVMEIQRKVSSQVLSLGCWLTVSIFSSKPLLPTNTEG
jgi:nicotinamide N-methyltransferase